MFGTTVGGYDVLSRVIWGTQTALLVIIVAVLLSIFAASLLGLFSGYFGGWLDRVLVVVCDAIYAFPSLLLAIVLAIVISGGQSSLWGGVLAAAISITVVFIPQYFRVIRAETVRIKAEAVRRVGEGARRVEQRASCSGTCFRNATRTLPLIFTLNSVRGDPHARGARLPRLRHRADRGAPSGATTSTRRSRDVTSGIWWTALYPGLAIVIAVLGITLVGESLNDLADPRLRGRRRVAQAAGKVAETSVVPGGTLVAGPGGTRRSRRRRDRSTSTESRSSR